MKPVKNLAENSVGESEVSWADGQVGHLINSKNWLPSVMFSATYWMQNILLTYHIWKGAFSNLQNELKAETLIV